MQFADLRAQAQQKCRKAVVLVRARATPDRCGTAREGKCALPAHKPATNKLLLSLVQMLLIHVHAKTDIVGTLSPVAVGHVLELRVALEIRHVILIDSKRRVVIDCKSGPPAAQNAGSI